jgi:hypothetical protein
MSEASEDGAQVSGDWPYAGMESLDLPSLVQADMEAEFLAEMHRLTVGVATEHSIEDPVTGEITGRMRLR